MINLKQLLTENTAPKEKILEAADHVRSGLEKVFAAGDVEISYRRCENVGLGYIKSISEAMKVSVTESRKVAKAFGYRDDSAKKKFIKEDNNFNQLDAQNSTSPQAKMSPEEQPHDETDMSNSEESREVKIGKEILRLCKVPGVSREDPYPEADLEGIAKLAQELIQMHGQK